MDIYDTRADTLSWSDALALDIPLMDQAHHTFVDLLAAAATAADQNILSCWTTLIAHTQQQFDAEDRWMLATGYAADSSHATQHKVILQVMREGEVLGGKEGVAAVRTMARELGRWFAQHIQSMDASLALHLRSAGYDPAPGNI